MFRNVCDTRSLVILAHKLDTDSCVHCMTRRLSTTPQLGLCLYAAALQARYEL